MYRAFPFTLAHAARQRPDRAPRARANSANGCVGPRSASITPDSKGAVLSAACEPARLPLSVLIRTLNEPTGIARTLKSSRRSARNGGDRRGLSRRHGRRIGAARSAPSSYQNPCRASGRSCHFGDRNAAQRHDLLAFDARRGRSPTPWLLKIKRAFCRRPGEVDDVAQGFGLSSG